VAERHKELTRMLSITTSKGGANIVPQNVADPLTPMLLTQPILRKSCGSDFGNVLMFGNG
jgi:hypothetical protein